jgi:hypothetical protein
VKPYEPVPDAARLDAWDRIEAAIERAAIMEFEGGLTRAQAEKAASEQWRVPVEWLRPQREESTRKPPPPVQRSRPRTSE